MSNTTDIDKLFEKMARLAAACEKAMAEGARQMQIALEEIRRVRVTTQQQEALPEEVVQEPDQRPTPYWVITVPFNKSDACLGAEQSRWVICTRGIYEILTWARSENLANSPARPGLWEDGKYLFHYLRRYHDLLQRDQRFSEMRAEQAFLLQGGNLAFGDASFQKPFKLVDLYSLPYVNTLEELYAQL